jgi:hypothetical protein
MSFITYPQENNKLAVIIPTGDVNNSIKDVPAGVEYKIVASLEIDNDFFNGYEFDKELGAKLNVSKAKEIWLNYYRTARTPLLAALDVDFMRAVESGDIDLQKEIASKKQALRDVTKVELPNTLEEIKNTWPEILGKNPFNK